MTLGQTTQRGGPRATENRPHVPSRTLSVQREHAIRRRRLREALLRVAADAHRREPEVAALAAAWASEVTP